METDKWGRRIRAFRKLKGYTQEGLAKNIGISVSSSWVKLKEATACPQKMFLIKYRARLEFQWRN